VAFHADISGVDGHVGFEIIECVAGSHAQAARSPIRPACATARGEEACNALRDTRATVALAPGYQMGLVVA
jgi:hypothetical protein